MFRASAALAVLMMSCAPALDQPSPLATVRSCAPFAAVGRGTSLNTASFGVPRSSTQPIVIVRGETPVELEWLDAPTLRRSDVDGAVVFDAPSSDHAWVISTTADALEDFHVLRSARAPTSFRYAIRGGLVPRVRGAELALEDAEGRARVCVPAPFAVDAAGVRRDLSVAVAAGVVTLSLDPRGLSYPVVVDPTWTLTGSMTTPRRYGASGLLSTGHFIVAAGKLTTGAWGLEISGAERYDPTSGAFTSAGSIAFGRWLPMASPLPGGRFGLFGGCSSDVAFRNVDIYDAATNAWTVGPALPTGRYGGTATLLTNGDVLIAGGSANAGELATCLLFDTTTLTWSATGSMSVARYDGVAERLLDGRVLATGGGVVLTTPPSEIYDPTTKSWATAATPVLPRRLPRSVLLADGRVLMTGGVRTGPSGSIGVISNAEIYDPVANTWTETASMSVPRVYHVMARLPNGQVVAAGGHNGGGLSTVEVYDPATARWRMASSLSKLRSNAHGAVLNTGALLVAGGDDNGITEMYSSAELFKQSSIGGTCTGDGDCAMGSCVDGVCCSSACTDPCRACDISGSLGTCAAVPSGAPHGSRSCAPYGACSLGACVSSCAADSECGSGFRCESGACIAKLANGEACTEARACLSGFCVDGVCCDTACTDRCVACDGASTKGACTAVTGAPHGSRTPCAGAGTCGGACDGTLRTDCSYPTPLMTCADRRCTDATHFVERSTCDGSGGCTAGLVVDCAPFACNALAGSCWTTCTSDADCAPATPHCESGTCVVAPPDAGVDSGIDAATDTGVSDTAAPPPDVGPDTTPADVADTPSDANSGIPTVAAPDSGCACGTVRRWGGDGLAYFVALAVLGAMVSRRRSI